MPDSIITRLAHVVRETAHPLIGAAEDYDSLMELIGDARLVLIGEASHGTHEFYRERAQITKRLIKEKSFTAVAVEADWPDAYRVNRYVRGTADSMPVCPISSMPCCTWMRRGRLSPSSAAPNGSRARCRRHSLSVYKERLKYVNARDSARRMGSLLR